MYKKLLIAVALASLSVGAVAQNKLKLNLVPGTISTGATAGWQVFKEAGNRADHRLVLAKNVPTSEFEAAGADISGIAGVLARDLNELCWKVEGGTVGGGSPRWNIYTGPAGGDFTKVTFLTANEAGPDGCFTDAEIEAALTANGVNLNDEIKYLQIIVDEQHTVVLDDIMVRIGENSYLFDKPGTSGSKKLQNKPRRY